MKKTIRTILCAAAVVLAAVSCQKSIEPSNPVEEGKETIDICVNGLMGEYSQQDGVKSSLVNNVRVAWAAEDVVYVFDGSKYLGKLTAALDKKADGQTDEDRYAKLGGTINAPATTPCVLSLVHSSLMTEPEAGAAVSELSIDMSAQSTETAPFVAYATMDYTGESISDVVVPFQFATSVIKVNCTGLKANTAIDKATLSNVNTACKLTLSGSTAPTVSGGTNGTITRTGDSYFAVGKVNGEGEAVFQIAVPVLETASEARILTVAQGSDEVKDKKFTTNSLVAATSVNTVCQLKGLPDGALPGLFTVGKGADGTEETADDVQVHFSKGNLTYDVEATTNKWKFYEHQYDRADNGSASATLISLFTWGYSQATSLLPVGNTYVTTHTTTEDKQLVYNTVSGDDWGVAYCESNNITVGTWRTLSTKEWQYLFNTRSNASNLYKCGVTVCGKANCVVLLPDNWKWDATADEHNVGTGWQTEYPETATVSNPVTWQKMEDAGAVCLPAAGYRLGSNVYGVGDGGLYWSSTAYGSNYAYYVYLSSISVYPDSNDDRSSGYSVRLITESK